MPPPEPYALTEADVMDLRLWAARTGFISDGISGVLAQAPWITYIMTDRAYALHSNGYTVAVTPRDDLACALLRNERLDPGYCRRLCDPSVPIDVALRTPVDREAYRRQQAAHAAHARLQREQEAEEARRRRTQIRIDPLSIEIEDLF